MAGDAKDSGMTNTLEQRVEEMEKKFSAFASQLSEDGKKDWLKTFGQSRDDAGFDEMIELGREYRRNLDRQD
jgi:hypothetical protein